MRLTTAILLLGCLTASAAGNGQTVSLRVENAPVKQVLREIIRQAKITIIYNEKDLKNAKPVTIELRNVAVEEALKQVLANQPLNFSTNGKTIFITPKPESHSGQGVIPGPGPESFPPIDIKGRILNEKGEPVIASVVVKGTGKGTTTNDNGEFELKGVDDNATLVISGVSIESFEVRVNGRSELVLSAKVRTVVGEEVVVEVNTGYQKIPKERATGSFVSITKDQLDQRVAPDIISKLEGITNALVFNKDPFTGSNKLRIRGESTIYANAEPLIVVDNFPYSGDINNLNPNDIENITILKDAAAASIWGVQAGNGVIVITTRKGKTNQPIKVELNSNWTLGNKPDLFYYPQINPSDYIDFETYLFSKGFYNTVLNNPSKRVVSPVIEILNKRRSGLITSADSASQINALKSNDLRNDLLKYMYQKSLLQQYQVNLSGGNNKTGYYFSTGYDKARSSIIGNTSNRISLNTQINFKPINNLDFNVNLAYIESNSHNSSTLIPNTFPYQQLVDAAGNELPISQRRATFEDTIINHGFVDWRYFPLQERNYSSKTSKNYDTRITGNLKYTFLKHLSAEVAYQYQRFLLTTKDLATEESYFIRDKMNTFAIRDPMGNYIGTNFPNGGKVDLQTSNLIAHNGRGALSYDNSWSDLHRASILVGFEVRDVQTTANSNSLLGFDDATGSFVIPDWNATYPTFPNGSSNLLDAVGTGLSYSGTINRFRSYFGNAAYTFKNRYTISGSVRFDGSNYFGVKANQKVVPLWSVGGKWDINKEKFYTFDLIPLLSLRATYGYNGNLAQNVAAITTFIYSSDVSDYTGLPYAGINNIPNAELRWEKSGQLNFALDFAFRNNRFSGTLEYFKKKGDDLIGAGYVDPTTGVDQLTGNFAGMKSNGFDIRLNSLNFNKRFKWVTAVNFNYAKEIVTRFDIKNNPRSFFNAFGTVYPEEGKPLYGLYSYRWAGLDPSTGGPRFYISDTVSKDYSGSLLSKFKMSDLVFSGKYNSPYTGNIYNMFSFDRISLAINITGKFGHYFRRKSIDYNAMRQNWQSGNQDYALRWKKPGDEKITNVPSFIYPDNSGGRRDNYYTFSDILIEKADHIRLQFINLNYSVGPKALKRLSLSAVQLFLYANNIGIIWRANDKKIDPDYPYFNAPPARTYSGGIRVSF